MYAEASGGPPDGSKHVKAQEWLRNKTSNIPIPFRAGQDDLRLHGDPEMAADRKVEEWQTESEYTLKKRNFVRKIEAVLAHNALQYRTGEPHRLSRRLLHLRRSHERKTTKFSPEIIERAVRMVEESQPQHESQWAAIVSIAAKIGCTAETLRRWVRQHETNTGQRPGLSTQEQQRIKDLERENRAAPSQRDPAQGQRIFRPGGARPPLQAVKAFIDEHRGAYGVEPICRVMQIAPSTYWLHAQRRAQPELRAERAKRDDVLVGEVERVWQENLQVYGVRKVWRQLRREGFEVAVAPWGG